MSENDRIEQAYRKGYDDGWGQGSGIRELLEKPAKRDDGGALLLAKDAHKQVRQISNMLYCQLKFGHAWMCTSQQKSGSEMRYIFECKICEAHYDKLEPMLTSQERVMVGLPSLPECCQYKPAMESDGERK